MAYTDFDGKRLYKERKIGSFTVAKLDVYLKENNLLPEGYITKKEKIALIEADLMPGMWPELLHVKFVIIWQLR